MAEYARWVACMLAGLATLVMVAFIFPLFPSDSAAEMSAYPAPVLAFEFATTPEDLTAIFGDSADPERQRRLDMMDHGNRWDFLFMTLYTMFGVLFGWAARRSGWRYGVGIMVCAIVAGLADAVETGLLLSLTDMLRNSDSTEVVLTYLRMPVTVKFAGIGATLIGASLYMLIKGGFSRIAPALALLCGGMVVIAAFGWPFWVAQVGTAIGIGWIVMIAYAAVQAARGFTPRRRLRP